MTESPTSDSRGRFYGSLHLDFIEVGSQRKIQLAVIGKGLIVGTYNIDSTEI